MIQPMIPAAKELPALRLYFGIFGLERFAIPAPSGNSHELPRPSDRSRSLPHCSATFTSPT